MLAQTPGVHKTNHNTSLGSGGLGLTPGMFQPATTPRTLSGVYSVHQSSQSPDNTRKTFYHGLSNMNPGLAVTTWFPGLVEGLPSFIPPASMAGLFPQCRQPGPKGLSPSATPEVHHSLTPPVPRTPAAGWRLARSSFPDIGLQRARAHSLSP